MGYSTRYALGWQPADTYKPKPLCTHKPPKSAKFCAECGRPVGVEALDDIVGDYIEEHEEMNYVLSRDGSSNESGKWYDHVPDLEKMSREIPGVLFHLEGEGEDAGDIWDAWALDGMVEKKSAEVVRATPPPEWKRRTPELPSEGGSKS